MKKNYVHDPIWEVEDLDKFANEFMEERVRKIRTNIARRMEELGMSQKEFVQEMTRDRRFSRGIANLTKSPDIITLGKIARLLGITYKQVTE